VVCSILKCCAADFILGLRTDDGFSILSPSNAQMFCGDLVNEIHQLNFHFIVNRTIASESLAAFNVTGH
jgi:hypothetical protein